MEEDGNVVVEYPTTPPPRWMPNVVKKRSREETEPHRRDPTYPMYQRSLVMEGKYDYIVKRWVIVMNELIRQSLNEKAMAMSRMLYGENKQKIANLMSVLWALKCPDDDNYRIVIGSVQYEN